MGRKIILILLVFILVFHISVLLSWVPMNFVWGGRIESWDQLVVFEAGAIVFVLIMIACSLMKINSRDITKYKFLAKADQVFAYFFAVSAVANLFSLEFMEAIISVPVASVLSIFFSWKQRLEKIKK